MYRLALLERMARDLIARLLTALGLAGRVYLRPVERLAGVGRRGGGRHRPLEVLFLCKGNICRSPYAEARLRRRVAEGAAEGPAGRSAGLDTTEGGGAWPRAIEVAAARGIDLRFHATKKCAAAMVDRADLIVVMEPVHLRKLGALSADARDKAILLGALLLDEGGSLVTPDPYGKSKEVFTRCFDKIDRAVEVLFQRLSGGRPGGGPERGEGV